MLLHANVDLQLFLENHAYLQLVERFASWRCKHLHWHRIQPSPDQWRVQQFKPFFEAANGRPIHGGALVCPPALQVWMRELGSQGEHQKAWEYQAEWIQRIVGENPQITSWDVINEAFPNGAQVRNVPWIDSDISEWDKLAEAYDWMDKAFRLAHAANPIATLYIKECLPHRKKRWQLLFKYVEHALDNGVPIHGVAVQVHSKADGWTMGNALGWVLRRVKRLGLKILLDETIVWDTLNHRIPKRLIELMPPAVFEQQQQQLYAEWRSIAEFWGVEALGFWSISDIPRDTWHPENKPVWIDGCAYWFESELRQLGDQWDGTKKPHLQPCNPGLWDEDLKSKPVVEVFPEIAR